MSHKIPFFAKRFVAGITLDEAIQAVEPLHEGGLFTSLDILGENVTSREEATGHLAAYKNIVSVIHEKKLPSNISIKLTMLGLDIDQNFCHENLTHLL